VLELLGRGAFGAVYKARDPELDRTVAIKVPRAEYFSTQEEEQRFLREARNTARLQHRNIVQVHEIGHERGMPYIVSDFIEGLTLADMLTGGRLTFRESAELVVKIADALDYAHSMGVVHRNIKPSNILLQTSREVRVERRESEPSTGTEPRPTSGPRPSPSASQPSTPARRDSEALSSQPFLTDFGLARRDEGEITLTLDGQVLGTPAYMSPEHAAGEHRKVDARGD
jgi:serine/threonine protein kinase